MAIPNNRTRQFIEDTDTRVSVGIDFPFARIPNEDGYFKTTKSTIDSIKNNIELLLQTQQGERVFQPRLGMGLRRFVFEQINENTKIEIENNIVDVFQTWLPFVDLKEININIDSENQDRNKIKIDIVFSLSRAPETLESVGIILE
jgi:phage baseplate assembly protein W|tara:strand:- start:114 stop:551 length:438 start_codon:yes stop_codon:yes gene_type:complete